jgi:hypothetical protein
LQVPAHSWFCLWSSFSRWRSLVKGHWRVPHDRPHFKNITDHMSSDLIYDLIGFFYIFVSPTSLWMTWTSAVLNRVWSLLKHEYHSFLASWKALVSHTDMHCFVTATLITLIHN